MKTWEMVKMLTENPKLRFKCKSSLLVVEASPYGHIFGYKSQPIILNLDREWEVYEEPTENKKGKLSFADGTAICHDDIECWFPNLQNCSECNKYA